MINPERDDFYRIDQKGKLWRGDLELDEEAYIDYFFQQLQENSTGRHADHAFVSRLGAETAFLKAADTPVVFKRLSEGKLFYTENLSVEFQPSELRFSEEGVLYHPAPIGNFGKIASQLVMQLGENIHSWGPYFAFKRVEDKCEHVIEPLLKAENFQLLKPRPENRCAGCGGANPNGLCLSFLYDKSLKTVHSWLIPDVRLEGAMGWMHGGYVSLLLDEVMGKALSVQNIRAATAQLNVRFRKPVLLHKEIELRGFMEKQNGRKNLLKGEIREAETGVILAEADALFISVAK
jgi:acyl-coenzyme A thioesterase PaaI-like protein